MRGGAMPTLFVEDQRQQRAGLFLKDVAYRLHAHFELTNKTGPDDTIQKFAEMFRRRANKGQCFNQPYLGCREFSCSFRLLEFNETPKPAIVESRKLGWMLYDMDYKNLNDPVPMFFCA